MRQCYVNHAERVDLKLAEASSFVKLALEEYGNV